MAGVTEAAQAVPKLFISCIRSPMRFFLIGSEYTFCMKGVTSASDLVAISARTAPASW